MKLMKFVMVAFCVTWLTGCATAAAPTAGAFFTDVKGPVHSGEGTSTAKTGQACAQNLLGLLAQGDASIDAAKKDGGIDRVTNVDHKTTTILGLYAQFCTVVHGE
jgi:hypothetical protein